MILLIERLECDDDDVLIERLGYDDDDVAVEFVDERKVKVLNMFLLIERSKC